MGCIKLEQVNWKVEINFYICERNKAKNNNNKKAGKIETFLLIHRPESRYNARRS